MKCDDPSWVFCVVFLWFHFDWVDKLFVSEPLNWKHTDLELTWENWLAYHGLVGTVRYLLLVKVCLYYSNFSFYCLLRSLFRSFSFQLSLLCHLTSNAIGSTMRHFFHCLGLTCVHNGCISCQMVLHSQILLALGFKNLTSQFLFVCVHVSGSSGSVAEGKRPSFA